MTPPTAEATVTETNSVVLQSVRPPLDLVLVVDRTVAMEPYRPLLKRMLGMLGHTLPGWPYYDVHLGVIAADLGGDGSDCPPAADKGMLQPLPQNVPFLARPCDGTQNVTGNPAQVVVSAGALPPVACGRNQPLAALRLALNEAVDLPPLNPGFLRPSSILSVLIMTAGDDESTGADGALLDLTETIEWLRARRERVSVVAMSGVVAPRLSAVAQPFCESAEPLDALDHSVALRCLVPPVTLTPAIAAHLPLLDRDPLSAGVQAECTVTVHTEGKDDEVMPPCYSGGSPCWRFEPSAASEGDLELKVEAPPSELSALSNQSWGCELVWAEVQCQRGSAPTP